MPNNHDTTADEEVELLDRWSHGDQDAGRELFARNYAAIARFFRNKVHDRDYEDLVQQTFLACVKSADSFRRASSFRTYLFGIARNKLRHYYRDVAKKQRLENYDPQTCSAVDLGITPSSAMAHHEEERLLLAALRRLPIDHQIVLELYYWEEMKVAEIAAILEEPEATLRRRLQRARERLRTAINTLTSKRQLVESTISRFTHWKQSLQSWLPKRPPRSAK